MNNNELAILKLLLSEYIDYKKDMHDLLERRYLYEAIGLLISQIKEDLKNE